MNIAREKFYTIMKPLKCYTMNEKVLQLERYEALTFSNTFPIVKPFSYDPLKLKN